MRTSFHALACLTIVLAATGCGGGPKLVQVKGTLTYNGKPLMAPPNGSNTVLFIPIVEPGKPYNTYAARANPETGAFTILGQRGDGIPVGKYRITVEQKMGMAEAKKAPGTLQEINERNARFAGKDSPFVREITDDEPLTLDLTNPTGK